MFVHLPLPVLPVLDVQQSATGKRFYVTPTGNKYPSITTLLGEKEKPQLTNWRNMLGPQKADKETKRCADRGTAIHEMVEKYLNNQQYPEFTYDYKQEYVSGFNQLRMRLNKINNIRVQEAALYSNVLKVAGRVDCIGEYEGVLSVIDFKTATKNKERDMIEDYFLQTTAYAIMWHELTNEPIEDIVILIATEKGLAPLVFKEKIDKYVKPLLKRINEYYRKQENGSI